MSNASDFRTTKTGCLTKYVGPGGDVVIPDSVTQIGSRAFDGCTGLTSVVIPDSVTRIGRWAFYGCTGLTSLVIPDSVTKIEDNAFKGCTGLTSLVIPDSVTKLDWGVFEGCTGLTSLVIPDSVTEIGDGAFYGCTGLTSLVIPDSVTRIGRNAFGNCTDIRLMISDIQRIPHELYLDYSRTNAILRFAKNGGIDFDEPYHNAYLKYIKSRSAKLVNLAMEHIDLLALMCEYKLIKPADAQKYEEAAQKKRKYRSNRINAELQRNKNHRKGKGET